MSNKKAVKAVYPHAVMERSYKTEHCVVYSYPETGSPLGDGDTPVKAWADAAKTVAAELKRR